MKIKQIINDSNFLLKKISEIYDNPENQIDRYKLALAKFSENFDDEHIIVISTPGRIEVCGNHTDHQLGKVIAAAIDIDSIAVVSKAENVRIISEGYDVIEMKTNDLTYRNDEIFTSVALVKGILRGFIDHDLKIGGFNVYFTSAIKEGSGLSSSANFALAIASIINCLFNDNKVNSLTLAKIAQYSESKYFNKPVGLMDQLAIASGGICYIDFIDKDNPKITKLNDVFFINDYQLLIMNTQSDHSDLSNAYADIVNEMSEVANQKNLDHLGKLEPTCFYEKIIPSSTIINDRSILRAHHFFQENKRVTELYQALLNNDMDKAILLIKNSGFSSYMYLQNIYDEKQPHHQKIAVALALCEYILNGQMAAYRIHGGGFGGSVLIIIKKDEVSSFLIKAAKLLPQNAVTKINVRNHGSICIID
ncbi:MAG: galactokinase family protein [Erysipelotrichaceae bacterium]|nr:galactokinase family protein [Erysipelotrichaceae bacterium]